MTTPQQIPLNQLSIDTRNIRKAGRGEAEPAFIGSIERKGIIEPMVVRQSINNGYLITNGGKRFAALQHMAKKGMKAAGVTVTDSYPVPIIVRDEDDAAATETSLITNIVRAPTHPVDQFEAFAELIKFGDTVDAIAHRYAMKTVEVRQALALAGVHAEIRKAWRDGKIDGEAAEAYALTKDLEHQVRIFKKLGKSNFGYAHMIEREIVGGHGSPDVDQMLKVVGVKDFEAAGHQVNKSLFDDNENRNTTVDNVPALRAMVSQKLADECERLKKDGWAWAIPADEAPKDIHAWRRLPGGTPTKEQKANAGCVVHIARYGTGSINIERGYIKPGVTIKVGKSPTAKAAAEKAKKTKDETGGISGGLAFRLSQQITKAAHDALAIDPALALRVAIAAMASLEYTSPAKISLSGMPDLERDDDYEFVKYLKVTSGKSQADLLKLLALWTARSLNMVCHAATSLPITGNYADDDEGGSAALLDLLQPKALNAALRQNFDAADYFKSVNGEMVRAAITEMGLKPVSNKKTELVDVAVARQKACGWLPRELRTKHYDGPAIKSKAPTKTPAKSTTKPKSKSTTKRRKAA